MTTFGSIWHQPTRPFFPTDDLTVALEAEHAGIFSVVVDWARTYHPLKSITFTSDQPGKIARLAANLRIPVTVQLNQLGPKTADEVEHALDMGAHAARRLLAGDAPGEPFAPVPFFWSDQYDRKIQLAGRVRPDDDLEVVAGAIADRRFCALYGRDGQVTGALGMNMPAKVIRYRRRLGEGPLGWDEALAEAAAGS